jgi:alkanesulfonate monooxygenase SsuD/methylene tetrahydromethanopterin reductase-like flavin-dependent oxidoreductase (luciferase family)
MSPLWGTCGALVTQVNDDFETRSVTAAAAVKRPSSARAAVRGTTGVSNHPPDRRREGAPEVIVLVGISIPQAGRLADPAAIRAAAVAAEQVGYASLWVVDDPARALDPIGVLTLAAAVTDRIRLGTSVLAAPAYPPALLARSLATLDLIAKGRLTVGLGLGRDANRLEGPGPDARSLAAGLEETLDTFDRTWAPGPRPPILLAGSTAAGLERVARRADGWNPVNLSADELAPQWARLRDLATWVGRDPDELTLVLRADLQVHDEPLGPDRACYSGSLGQVAEDLDAARQAGVREVILGVAGDPTLDEALDQYARLAELLEGVPA